MAVPPGVVTEIVTVPAARDLVTALMVVALVTVKLAAAVPPNVTAVAPVRLVPVMVTVVPPAVGPVVGTKLVIVGGATNLKVPGDVAVPPGVVSDTATVPAAWAGATALTVVGPVTVKLLADVVPNLTAVTPVRLVPVTVTVVPPVVGPAVGAMPVTVGAGTNR